MTDFFSPKKPVRLQKQRKLKENKIKFDLVYVTIF